jgi:hypothetical protein
MALMGDFTCMHHDYLGFDEFELRFEEKTSFYEKFVFIYIQPELDRFDLNSTVESYQVPFDRPVERSKVLSETFDRPSLFLLTRDLTLQNPTARSKVP